MHCDWCISLRIWYKYIIIKVAPFCVSCYDLDDLLYISDEKENERKKKKHFTFLGQSILICLYLLILVISAVFIVQNW